MKNVSQPLRRLSHLFQQKSKTPNADSIIPAGDKTMKNVKPKTPTADSIIPAGDKTMKNVKPNTHTADSIIPAGDKKIQILVNRFKKKSGNVFFRRRHSLYKDTVGRLAQTGSFSSIHDILDHHKQYPDIKDEHFAARLIRLYGQAKMLDHALNLFDEMPDLNCPQTVLSFNALLAACFFSKSFTKAVELFDELPGKLSIKPNVISYTSVIRAYCEMGLLDDAVSKLGEMEKNDVSPNVVTYDTFFGAFYGRRRFEEAEKLWSSMEEKKIVPDLRCYNWKILGMVNEKRLSEALELFNGLEGKGLKPNTHTFNLIIKGFTDECNIEEVKKWHTAMVDSGCEPNFVTCTTIVAFACDNDIDFAFEMCKKYVCLKKKLSGKILKQVTDELIRQSKTEEAKELLEMYDSKSEIDKVLDLSSVSLLAGD